MISCHPQELGFASHQDFNDFATCRALISESCWLMHDGHCWWLRVWPCFGRNCITQKRCVTWTYCTYLWTKGIVFPSYSRLYQNVGITNQYSDDALNNGNMQKVLATFAYFQPKIKNLSDCGSPHPSPSMLHFFPWGLSSTSVQLLQLSSSDLPYFVWNDSYVLWFAYNMMVNNTNYLQHSAIPRLSWRTRLIWL